MKLIGFRRAIWALLVSMQVACASYGVIGNEPIPQPRAASGYSLQNFARQHAGDDTIFLVSFSGGGTRAAALSYGVLQALRDTAIVTRPTVQGRMIDLIDVISSVSGGSFTAAYFGLHGDRIFEDFEDVFLRRDIQTSLIRALLNPFRWFTSTGRTELAVQHYEDAIFKGATYADLQRHDAPLIMINASDLAYGARLTFLQEYFDLLCSDLSSFPISRAVAASAAVPILFNPIVLRNHDGCHARMPPWLESLKDQAVANVEIDMAIRGLESYLDKDKRHYAHLVDGGITDNLGLRAIYDLVALGGGPRALLRRLGMHAPRRLVLLSVNAATVPEPQMDRSNRQPSLEEAANAVSDVQIHRYNAATVDLMRQSLARWAEELSGPGHPVASFYIDVSLQTVKDRPILRLLNLTPTSFALSDEQVDRLTATGRALVLDHPEFRRLQRHLDDAAAAARD
ncbi:MAG: patatin-like phospholipase family protein [Burkholderiaceae bacterium]